MYKLSRCDSGPPSTWIHHPWHHIPQYNIWGNIKWELHFIVTPLLQWTVLYGQLFLDDSSKEATPNNTNTDGNDLASTVDKAASSHNFKGVRETGEKLITEANQRYLAAQEEVPKIIAFINNTVFNIWNIFSRKRIRSMLKETSLAIGQDLSFPLTKSQRYKGTSFKHFYK